MNQHLIVMPTNPDRSAQPEVKKVGPRRVRTAPREGQLEEPDAGHEESNAGENDERLKADKPPHY